MYVIFFYLKQNRGHLYNEFLWSCTSGNFLHRSETRISIRYFITHQLICMLGFVPPCFVLPVCLCYDSIAQSYLYRELRGLFCQRHSKTLKGNTQICRKINSENMKWLKLTANAKGSVKTEMIKKMHLEVHVRNLQAGCHLLSTVGRDTEPGCYISQILG